MVGSRWEWNCKGKPKRGVELIGCKVVLAETFILDLHVGFFVEVIAPGKVGLGMWEVRSRKSCHVVSSVCVVWTKP